jgi:hypothetical protein
MDVILLFTRALPNEEPSLCFLPISLSADRKISGGSEASSFIARKGERWEEIDSMECHHGTYCPYLNGEDVLRLLSERDCLSQQLG